MPEVVESYKFKYYVIQTHTFAGATITGFLKAKYLHVINFIYLTDIWINFWDSLTPGTGKVLIDDFYFGTIPERDTKTLIFNCELDYGLSWKMSGGSVNTGDIIVTYLER